MVVNPLYDGPAPRL